MLVPHQSTWSFAEYCRTDKDGRTYFVDRNGSKDYTKGYYQTDKNGVTVKVDKYGQKQWSEGTFITEKPRQRPK